MVIIAITNQKGGVGKTTTTVHLAHGLALRGKRVLIVDLDTQGQVSITLGAEQTPGVYRLLVAEAALADVIAKAVRPNLDILPGNKRTEVAQKLMGGNPEDYPMNYIGDLLKPAAHDYDYVLFDTAPTIGGLQERAIWAAKWVIIPAATEFMSLDGLKKSKETLDVLTQRGWKGHLLGVLPTFFDSQTRESQTALTELSNEFRQRLLTPIHRATTLRECFATGQTVFETFPRSRAASDYELLVHHVLERAK